MWWRVIVTAPDAATRSRISPKLFLAWVAATSGISTSSPKRLRKVCLAMIQILQSQYSKNGQFVHLATRGYRSRAPIPREKARLSPAVPLDLFLVLAQAGSGAGEAGRGARETQGGGGGCHPAGGSPFHLS